ncbi:hypothetical protein [Corynebacterium sp. H78]|uniref:hypothetical protein n=1 Tax=Corynebacterium sp. H78 TaxID=3133417 RepID=UPI0030A1F7CE
MSINDPEKQPRATSRAAASRVDSTDVERAIARRAAINQLRMGQAFVASWILILTAVILWPLFAGPAVSGAGSSSSGTRGSQLLLRDMVIPAHPPLTDASLGLTEAAARAIPQDTVLWAVGYVVDANVAVKVLLALSFIIGGLAAAELARVVVGARIIGQIAAATMLLWNPFVAERLLQGHWSLVVAAMLLPAIALASINRQVWWRASALALAGLTPTGALLGGVVAVVASRSWRDRVVAFFTTIAVSAPWLLATALSGGGTSADMAGAAAFSARAEHYVGTIGALLALGGLWNGEAVPESRNFGFASLAVILLMAFFAIGVKTVWRAQARLVVMAGVAIVVIALFATPTGIAAMELLLNNIPGAGLLRDAQKWVALAIPAYVLLAAASADLLARNLPPGRQWLAVSVAALAIMSAVPNMPKDMEPLRPVPAWSGWSAVSGVVAMDTSAVTVLPAGSYRLIDGRPVYDPAIKTLPAPVVTSGNLVVSGTVVSGEGSRTVEHTLLSAPDDALQILRTNGVGWVLLENSPGEFGRSDAVIDQLDEVFVDENLALYRVPGAIELPEPASSTQRGLAWAAFAVWLLMLSTGVLRAMWPGPRRREANLQISRP